MAEWRQQKFANRKTPLHLGNGPGTNVQDKPLRQAGEHYTTTGYGHSIACLLHTSDAADDPPGVDLGGPLYL